MNLIFFNLFKNAFKLSINKFKPKLPQGFQQNRSYLQNDKNNKLIATEMILKNYFGSASINLGHGYRRASSETGHIFKTDKNNNLIVTEITFKNYLGYNFLEPGA